MVGFASKAGHLVNLGRHNVVGRHLDGVNHAGLQGGVHLAGRDRCGVGAHGLGHFNPGWNFGHAQANAAHIVGLVDLLARQENPKTRSPQAEDLHPHGLFGHVHHLATGGAIQHPADMVEITEQKGQRHKAQGRCPVGQGAQIAPAHVQRAELQGLGRGAQVKELRGWLDVYRHLPVARCLDTAGKTLSRLVADVCRGQVV